MKRYDQLTRDDIFHMWLALKFINRPHAFRSLIDTYGSAYAVAQDLSNIHAESPELLREEDVKRCTDDPPEAMFERVWKRMKASDLVALFYGDDDYPAPLMSCQDAPPVLFARGQMPDKNALFVCVVGTRKFTEYGESMVCSIVRELAENGVTVVSGMAFGTDSIAAQAALDHGSLPCRTVAVMPGGADICYPASQKELYSDIIEDGLILSKYEPGTRARDFRFAERNKLMAALSRCVLFTEGSLKSGALMTARYSLEYGKPVFSVPGRTTDPMSAAPNMLIASGDARSVSSGAEILTALGLEVRESIIHTEPDIKTEPSAPKYEKELSVDQLAVIKCLETGDKSFDELLEFSGLDFLTLNMVLTSMEFSRIIKQIQGGLYSKS